MRLGGFEPPTPALGGPRSIHLSYRRKTCTLLDIINYLQILHFHVR